MPACSADRGAKIQYLRGFATRCVIGKSGHYLEALDFFYLPRKHGVFITLIYSVFPWQPKPKASYLIVGKLPVVLLHQRLWRDATGLFAE